MDDPNPVSYTHLDVYKRQLSYDAMTVHTAVVFTRYMMLSLEIRCLLYTSKIPDHSIITDKWMITIALIVKVKGSAFLPAVCIKKSGIQIQNNSLWHLNTDVYKRQ